MTQLTIPAFDVASETEPRERGGKVLTPMFQQYFAVKEQHPGCILFFRMGDFYELFFEDAEKVAAELDIVLTTRGVSEGEPVPMCGVPAHASENYLARLTRRGFRIAVCEQVERPEQARRRGHRAVLKREVVQVVTPGTVVDEHLLEARENSFLAGLAQISSQLAVAFADISTGEVEVEAVDLEGLEAALARDGTREIIVADALARQPEIEAVLAAHDALVTELPAARFTFESSERRVREHYQVLALDAFGAFTRAEVTALGAVFDYAELTQQESLPVFQPPRRVEPDGYLGIDAATHRNLELTRSLTGTHSGSLLEAVDRTVTAAGARRLAGDLARPLTDCDRIATRHDRVEWLVAEEEVRTRVRSDLRRAPDSARALSRIAFRRGGPRDLRHIADGLAVAADVRAQLAGSERLLPLGLQEVFEALDGEAGLAALLGRAVEVDAPRLVREGGFVRPGFRTDLDEQRALRDESRRLIAAMQAEERESTGVHTLKIRHNRVLGYFLEVPSGQTEKLKAGDADGRFQLRQTLAGASRFMTPELASLAERIELAGDRVRAIEEQVFAELSEQVLARSEPVQRIAGALAALDVAQGFAEIARERNYVRPAMHPDTRFRVIGGRHAVVEAAVDGTFVTNDCQLDDAERIWLVTGPNMAGKSTFLRQNALIVVLAQAGGYVPAESAEIGVVDRLFSRVGAADDLARGRSTFMVEMVETAAILNQASPRSFVILDEVGRGTATFDGLSIAWATVEYLHGRNRCRSLFATHYHELTQLAERLDALACRTLRVREWKGEVVFLYAMVEGVSSRAYGIDVGRLAGLPGEVLDRARQILARLEAEGGTVRGATLSTLPPPSEPESDPVADLLDSVDPDSLSPRGALELVYRLVELRRNGYKTVSNSGDSAGSTSPN